MITLEELNELVIKECSSDSIATKEWLKITEQLKPTVYPYFNENDDWVIPTEPENGTATTYFDDIAYFCWKCGCNLWVTQDYWDGSETFYISLPSTEEEYRKNLNEADAWWKEVME